MAGRNIGGSSAANASTGQRSCFTKENKAFADGWESKRTGVANPFTAGAASATGAQFSAFNQGLAATNPPGLYGTGNLYETADP